MSEEKLEVNDRIYIRVRIILILIMSGQENICSKMRAKGQDLLISKKFCPRRHERKGVNIFIDLGHVP